MENKYQMSSCGQFKKPVTANLEPAIQDKDWQFVNEILTREAKYEIFKEKIIRFNQQVIIDIYKNLPKEKR